METFKNSMYMYVCRLFDNIEFRANPLLYTIAQFINELIKIMKEKNVYIYKTCKSKKKKTQLFQKSLEYPGFCRSTTLRSDHANSSISLT
jgi:hypothetical protein